MRFNNAPAPGSAQRVMVEQAQESIASEATQTEARRCSPPLLIAREEHIGPQGFVALLHRPIPCQESNRVQMPRSGRVFPEHCMTHSNSAVFFNLGEQTLDRATMENYPLRFG